MQLGQEKDRMADRVRMHVVGLSWVGKKSISAGAASHICIPTTSLDFCYPSRLKWPGSLSPGLEASTSQLLPFHSSKVSVLHSSHVVCALRIRDASEGDDMGGH